MFLDFDKFEITNLNYQSNTPFDVILADNKFQQDETTTELSTITLFPQEVELV